MTASDAQAAPRAPTEIRATVAVRPRLAGVAAVALLVLLGVAVYGTGLSNRALLHHPPTPFVDAPLDDSLLQSHRLALRLFTSDFLLRTYGEYRPLGYALFALLHSVVPGTVGVAWHAVFLAVHVLTALLVFLTLRLLVEVGWALGLAAGYTAFPLFVPLVNDFNQMHLTWGLLLSAATVWLFALYLRPLDHARGRPEAVEGRRRSAGYLVLSILAFAAAGLAWRGALTLPGLLIALILLHEKQPRAAAALVAWLALGGFAAGLLGIGLGFTALGQAVIALIVGSSLAGGPGRFRTLAAVLPLYLAVIGLVLAVASGVRPTPLQLSVLDDSLVAVKFQRPFQPAAILKAQLAAHALARVSLVLAFLLPASLFLRRRIAAAALVGVPIVFLVGTMSANRDYRTNVTYWQTLSRVSPPEDDVVAYHLAQAYVEEEQWDAAWAECMRLRYDGQHPVLVRDMLSVGLAKCYAHSGPSTLLGAAVRPSNGGKDKLAGYFYLAPPYRAEQLLLKQWLIETGDYYFDVGYISNAECCWARAQQLDPHDARLYVRLGRALTYMNFYRAAARYFTKALELDPHNATALYHLAFLAHVWQEQGDYDRYGAAWQQAVGTTAESFAAASRGRGIGQGGPTLNDAGAGPGRRIDFQPLFDKYATYDREKMVGWFSEYPLEVACKAGPENKYTCVSFGRTYKYHEVPLEIARYFQQRMLEAIERRDVAANDYARQTIAYLVIAHECEPTAREPLELLVDACRRGGAVEQARQYQQLLEALPHAAP